MISKVLGYILIITSFVLVMMVFYLNSKKSDIPIIFSPTQMLAATWNNYKNNFLEEGTGRTIDPVQNITTSEGQSYTMLRAVWQGDKEVFDTSWMWTKNNLQHKKGDHLFAWKFGEKADGSYGVLTNEGGDNTASDGDIQIALALLFAYSRWQEHAYLGDARLIMDDIWEKEVVTIKGEHVLAANDKEKASLKSHIVVNPSYFNPAAYKIFAKFDNSHDWEGLAKSSYTLLEKSMAHTYGGESAGLPPDWIQINRNTGVISTSTFYKKDSNYGFDAMRVPWMLALDIEWFDSPDAKRVLEKFTFLQEEWERNNKLNGTYNHDGTPLQEKETPATYGTSIGYFMNSDPALAKSVYENKLLFLYSPGINTWKTPLSYYDDNWAWFGIALYNHLVRDETALLPKEAFIQ